MFRTILTKLTLLEDLNVIYQAVEYLLNLDTIDYSIKLLYSKTFIAISLSLSIGILWYLYIYFSDKDIHLKDLENEDMLFTYFLITIVSSSLIWNVFLLIHKIIFNLEYHIIEEVLNNLFRYLEWIVYTLIQYSLTFSSISSINSICILVSIFLLGGLSHTYME